MNEHKTEEKKEAKKSASKRTAKKSAPEKKEEHKAPEHKSAEHVEQKAHEHKPAEHVEHKPVEHKPEHKPVEHKSVEAPKPAETKSEPKKSRKKPAKKGEKVIVVRGKRKESVARATIQKGRGIVRVNKINVDALSNKYMRDIIKEPLRFVGAEATTVDISVNVVGGGAMGQAQAARTAIANALVGYFDADKSIQDRMFAYDKFMIVEDSRRVEPKKYKGPKARARFQKSYR